MKQAYKYFMKYASLTYKLNTQNYTMDNQLLNINLAKFNCIMKLIYVQVDKII